MKRFKFTKDLVLRGEHAYYHALCLLVPELRNTERVLDASLLSNGLGKRKSIHDLRPDYYHYFDSGTVKMSIHGEYDETDEHEDSDDRVRTIAEVAGCLGRTYLIRVKAHHYTKKTICVRRNNQGHVYWYLTEIGHQSVQKTALLIKTSI